MHYNSMWMKIINIIRQPNTWTYIHNTKWPDRSVHWCKPHHDQSLCKKKKKKGKGQNQLNF